MSIIKDFIKKITGETRIQNNINTIREEQKENEARIDIVSMLKFHYPFTSWALSPSVLRFILNDILISKRKNIIEFGSGVSTLVIANLICNYKLDINFLSIEHDEIWYEITMKYLEENDLINKVEYLFCPLKDDNAMWYELPERVYNFPYDQIIVDGPPSKKGNRFGFIETIKKMSVNQENYVLIIDDTDRFTEKKMVEQLKTELGLEVINYKNTSILTTTGKTNRLKSIL